MRDAPSYFYSAYGLTLRSNAPFPHLPVAEHGTHDVEIDLAGEAEIPAPPDQAVVHPDGVAVLVEADGCRVVTYTDAQRGARIQLRFSRDGAHARVAWTAGIFAADVPAAMMGPLLGTCLRLRGIVCLHAGAVAINGGAVVLLGRSGAGKSTATAALMKRGHPLITDDIAALDPKEDGVWVRPGPGHIRLMPDVAVALGETPAELPPLLTDPGGGEGKRLLCGSSGGPVQSGPVRATALCFMERTVDGSPRPTLVPLSAKETVPRLMRHLFIRGRPERPLGGQAFRTCALLASTCRSHAVRGALRLEDLGELADLIASGGEVQAREEAARKG